VQYLHLNVLDLTKSYIQESPPVVLLQAIALALKANIPPNNKIGFEQSIGKAET
jgi:hypothetical protein